jgi:hypothetical protein
MKTDLTKLTYAELEVLRVRRPDIRQEVLAEMARRNDEAVRTGEWR